MNNIKVIFIALVLYSKLVLASGLFNKENINKVTNLESFADKLHQLRRNKRSKSSCIEDCSCSVQKNGNKDVHCFGAGMTEVPSDIPVDAFSLNLAHNRIQIVTASSFKKIIRLEHIDFSYNKINLITAKTFKDQQQLNWLDLSHNVFTNFDIEQLSDAARSLVTLNISNTNINKFPKLNDGRGISMNKLQTLIISKNNISEIPPSHIPSTVKKLDISCLRLTEISSASFRGLRRIENLEARGCGSQEKLRAIENSALVGLTKLIRLDLSNNVLSKIPRGLPENLQYLDLSYNRINEIKSGECATQEELISYYTSTGLEAKQDFQNIGSVLSQLTQLVELNLSDNLIYSLCVDDFILMTQLKVLNLASNKITSFHRETFLYPQSLKTLDLSRNHITQFDIAELPDLEELYVQRNFISEIEDISRNKLPSLKEADFSYNRYNCDCHLKSFIQFLAEGYNQDITFLFLSATSQRYTCNKPANLRDKPLMNVNINTELICGEPKAPIPWAAIAAPVSLVVLILVIVIILRVAKWRSCQTSLCCICCKKNTKKDDITSSHAKYDVDNDIIAQNKRMNDLAILSHEDNRDWVLKTLVPKLHQNSKNSSLDGDKGFSFKLSRNRCPLQMEVFTIGKTIKIGTLNRCIDTNDKIAIIITHEFLHEESCIYILKEIQQRLCSESKDTVLCVIMDSIVWSAMPDPLQKLMTEKTFLQFPQRDRGRQEFYFWDNFVSFVMNRESHSRQRYWMTEEEHDMPSSIRYQHRYSDDQRNSDTSTIRSSRRANTGDNESIRDEKISTARAARLKRLGIKSNGDVIDGVLAGIAEAKSLAQRNQRNREVNTVSQHMIDKGLNAEPSTFDYPTSRSFRTLSSTKPQSRRPSGWQDESLQQDIDQLYSSRMEMKRFGSNNNGRVRSLLPPNCDDVDSIYSEDEEGPLPGYEVRPPERSRSISMPNKGLQHMPRTNEQKSENGGDVMENLHGTVAARDAESIFNDEDNDDDLESNATDKKKKKKKSKTISKLKSFF